MTGQVSRFAREQDVLAARKMLLDLATARCVVIIEYLGELEQLALFPQLIEPLDVDEQVVDTVDFGAALPAGRI